MLENVDSIATNFLISTNNQIKGKSKEINKSNLSISFPVHRLKTIT